MRVSAAGGSPEILTAPDVSKNELSYRWPEILPSGKAILFVIASAQDIGSFSESKIAAIRLDTREKKILPIVGTNLATLRVGISYSNATDGSLPCRSTLSDWASGPGSRRSKNLSQQRSG